jgi:hypothetical protein
VCVCVRERERECEKEVAECGQEMRRRMQRSGEKTINSDYQMFNGHLTKSASSFCHQVAAWVPPMVCDFYLIKKLKIVNNSTTAREREKISTYLESLEF